MGKHHHQKPVITGQSGEVALAVRRDSATVDGAADGELVTLSTDAAGNLRVAASISGSGATDLGKAEDSVATSGDVGVAALAVRRDTASAGAADGDYVNLSTDSVGNLRTLATLTDGTNPAEILAAGADATANTVNEVVTGAMNYGYNGATWDRLRSDTTNGLDVDVTRVAVPSAGPYSGQKNVTSAGTEVALASTQALTQGVWVKAKHANTNMIYVGINGVTSSTGYVLDAGESVFVAINDLATVFIDSDTNGEGVSFIGF